MPDPVNETNKSNSYKLQKGGESFNVNCGLFINEDDEIVANASEASSLLTFKPINATLNSHEGNERSDISVAAVVKKENELESSDKEMGIGLVDEKFA